MARRTAHVDIDDFGTSGFGDARAFRHPSGLAARELNDVRAYSCRLASQPRHWAAIYEIIAGGHFGNDKPSAKCGAQTSKRGIGYARHRCEKNPVGNLNIAYFQRLNA
jgi:hypothetical protein